VSRQPGSGDAEAIQQRIRQAREQLLGGRGPGASALETARWKTERPSLGGRDPAAAREAVAERAAAIRGDQVALERLIARHRAQPGRQPPGSRRPGTPVRADHRSRSARLDRDRTCPAAVRELPPAPRCPAPP